jgi:hypothetical protein
MPSPKTDDFRLERREDKLLLTFTPTGAQYSFTLARDGADPLPVGERAPRGESSDYDSSEVENMAAALAKKALAPPHSR